VRRELGLGIDEWDGLPWWHARAYLEGLEGLGVIQRNDVDVLPPGLNFRSIELPAEDGS
jgi:hypothetical protein